MGKGSRFFVATHGVRVGDGVNGDEKGQWPVGAVLILTAAPVLHVKRIVTMIAMAVLND